MILESLQPMMRTESWWSEDRVVRLKTLWDEGFLSASRIAADLQTTRNAVLGKVHRLGLASRSASHEGRKPPNAHTLKLTPQKAVLPNVRIDRVPRTRGHEGMKPLPISELNRMIKDPTKNQLREMLAQAVRNTAAMTPATEAMA